MKRADRRAWHQGPVFDYRASSKLISVKVTGSSWPLHGNKMADGVTTMLERFKKLHRRRIVDFGAGSWLRYSESILELIPNCELYAVEYSEAFHDQAAAVKQRLENDMTFWRPFDFVNSRGRRFDLILLVNVLNTIPEDSHRRSIFSTLADRLNPSGWLLVYQRIWARSENPPDAIDYGDGWLVPQEDDSYTFRSSSGKRWFNEQATAAKLRELEAVEISSANTLLRLWEKPF